MKMKIVVGSIIWAILILSVIVPGNTVALNGVYIQNTLTKFMVAIVLLPLMFVLIGYFLGYIARAIVSVPIALFHVAFGTKPKVHENGK